VTLAKSIEQSAWLAGFLAGCFKNDVQLIRDSMKDVIIEPQRSQLIPGFQEMKKEALRMGALGFSISGSGPSVFAWADSKELADKIGKKISSIFASQNIGSQTWVTPLQANGARIMR
jgi:homoserine kinase